MPTRTQWDALVAAIIQKLIGGANLADPSVLATIKTQLGSLVDVNAMVNGIKLPGDPGT